MKCFKENPQCLSMCDLKNISFSQWWKCYIQFKGKDKITAFDFWIDATKCIDRDESFGPVNKKYEQLLANDPDAFVECPGVERANSPQLYHYFFWKGAIFGAEEAKNLFKDTERNVRSVMTFSLDHPITEEERKQYALWLSQIEIKEIK